MNFALLQTLYWKQGGRMKVSEASVVISCLHRSRYSLSLPRLLERTWSAAWDQRASAGRGGDRLRTRNSQRDTLNTNAITPLTGTLIFLAPKWS